MPMVGMNAIVISLMIVVATAGFLFQIRRQIGILFKLRKDNRLDHLGERAWNTVRFAFVQKRMFRRPLAGIAHLLIFAAFVGTVLNELVYFTRGYVPDATLPLPHW